MKGWRKEKTTTVPVHEVAQIGINTLDFWVEMCYTSIVNLREKHSFLNGKHKHNCKSYERGEKSNSQINRKNGKTWWRESPKSC